MACGMGACYACVVHVKGESDAKNLRVCEEGVSLPYRKSHRLGGYHVRD